MAPVSMVSFWTQQRRARRGFILAQLDHMESMATWTAAGGMTVNTLR